MCKITMFKLIKKYLFMCPLRDYLIVELQKTIFLWRSNGWSKSRHGSLLYEQCTPTSTQLALLKEKGKEMVK